MTVGPREQFRDGAGLMGSIPNPYLFTVNHREEEAAEQVRNITRQAVTTGPKFVLQQGEPSPRVLRYAGTILTSAQLTAMQAYYDACSTRTIFFRDVSGIEYEVLITRFAPQRKATLRNPREPTILWYWTYQLDMEVIR
jgi:hypothetical protein